MKLFSYLYDRALRWSQHPHAVYYLAWLSASESSFFPIPPDVMLAPMSLANRSKALHYATLTTVSSTVGGLFGYLLGMFFFFIVHPLLIKFGYWPAYLQVQLWFAKWGFWAVFVGGFAPIPYKLFTIGAGAAHMAILPFVMASFIGRGLRFYALAGLMYWGGERMEATLRKYIEWVGWLFIIVLILGYLFLMHYTAIPAS